MSKLSIYTTILFCLLLSGCVASAAAGHAHAQARVKNLSCGAGQTVDQLLNRKHRNMHTDLGWSVFANEDGGFWVERVFMVSKSAPLRYRWMVSADNAPQALSVPAQKLCGSESSSDD